MTRRPPHRHRRRQPLCDGRRRPRLDSPFCAGPTLLASLLLYWHNHPSPELPVQRHVHWPHQPGAPRGRSAAMTSSLSWRSRWVKFTRRRPKAACPAPGRPKPGKPPRGAATHTPWGEWGLHAALAAGPNAAQYPGGRDRQHPPQRVLHRQDVLTGPRPPAGWVCWSCALSRCRPTRA